MIDKIRIKNLQSHVDTTIDFHPGTTVLTGASDVGKSSVIRALIWVAINKPSGDGLRRHKTKKTEVSIGKVTKLRTASKHQYTVSDKVFKAIRTDVPTEVAEQLRLSNINFQSQHQPYFLISDSPGKVARTLNEVGDLQVIDESLKNIKSRARAAKAEEKWLQEQLTAQEESVDLLKWVPGADAELKIVEKLSEDVKMLKSEVVALDKALWHAADLTRIVESIPDTENDAGILSDNLAQLNTLEISVLKTSISSVLDNEITTPYTDEDLISVYAKEAELLLLNTGVRQLSGTLEEVTSREIKLPEVTEDCGSTLENINNLITQNTEVSSALNEVLVAEDCFDFADKSLIDTKVEYDQKLKDAGHCPLCGGDL